MNNIPDNVRNHSNIILFDGVCNLCSGFMQFVYKNDPAARFKFAWLQEESGKEILCWLNMPAQEYKTIIYIEKGQAFYRSAAVLHIVKYLRFPWPLFALGKIFPESVRDHFYNWVATNRYKWFGQKEQCLRPTGDLLTRFLN